MHDKLLKDFIATAQKNNYNWNTVFDKFPELENYDKQLLKDYVATAEKNNYNYEVVNSKFPEFGFKKKKKVKPKMGVQLWAMVHRYLRKLMVITLMAITSLCIGSRAKIGL